MLKIAKIIVVVMMSALIAEGAAAQNLGAKTPEALILREMVGTWTVKQTMWTGSDADPIDLPPAVANRKLADGGGFVEEVMTLAEPGGKDAFMRTSYINYNAIDGVFEYFSIDSRAPQQMHYQSQPTEIGFDGVLALKGGTFVAAQWGDRKDVAFSYRVELSPVENDRQELSLYLRPLGAQPVREFKAFNYQYSRKN